MLILATKLKNQFPSAYTTDLKNIIINGDKRGCSGFITANRKTVYVTTEPFASLGFMYRTAEFVGDYEGGVNRFARDIESLVAGINALLKEQALWTALSVR